MAIGATVYAFRAYTFPRCDNETLSRGVSATVSMDVVGTIAKAELDALKRIAAPMAAQVDRGDAIASFTAPPRPTTTAR